MKKSTKKSKPTTKELYAQVTEHIISALETADPNGWRAPWHSQGGLAAELPYNIVSKKNYRGVNVFVLWTEQLINGYRTGIWATFDQWKARGCKVKPRPEGVEPGHWGTKVLLWKPTKRKVEDENGDEKKVPSLYTTSYTVFNADQVDGFVYDEEPVDEGKTFDAIEHADEWLISLGAKVSHGGNKAYYTPAADRIQLPKPEDFNDNGAYYSTSAHEHVHWTGHKDRCDRDLHNRFGTAAYAAEELVAELGSAYVCAHLHISNEPRQDHAHYLANWLQILKEDPSALVTAASKAQQATDWLIKQAEGSSIDEEVEVDDEASEAALV